MAILDIHNELLDLLVSYSKDIPNFRFRPRKTNRSNRLASGHWFLGNEDYLAIGFWSGDDWRTKLPNIAFMVDYEGSCWLHFSATDTDKKFNFILNNIFPELGIIIREKDFIEKGGKYNHPFKGRNIKECLLEFIDYYWPKIDNVIKKQSVNEDSLIRIIDESVFNRDLEKVLYYKKNIEQIEEEINYIKPSKLIGFEIKNYRSIKHLILENIPLKSQWIFLTGENGVGKSNIIKALAKTIGFGKIEENETDKVNLFECELFLKSSSIPDENQAFLRSANNHIGRIKPLLLGFAAYGPFRLNPIHGGLSANQLQEARSKNGNLSTLFSNKAYLLDLETQYKEWYDSPNNQEFANRTYIIKEFLEGLLLNIGEVGFGHKINGIPTTLFREKDGENNLYNPVGIEKLSSGYMSILAMMSDLLVRLYRQQPEIDDPGELRGTVLIDEIDIHLHPKFQKHFVEQLTAAFPKVQFIVTTHSPIPLLGAPKNSVICVVKRNVELGTYIDRIDEEIIIEDMLPNAILSSPVFGFKELFPVSHNKNKKIRTEDNFEDLIKNDELKSKLKEIAINLRNK
ncbi:AAA family ATPase [Flavobacterium sp.]|jgi:predicted ATPase|uniref:AAA family ATPase n=1 Tax=Flavobacterium sp. TaxID=239 RepID=UPI0037BE5B4C